MANKKDLESYLRKNALKEKKVDKDDDLDEIPDERSLRPAGKTVTAYGLRKLRMDASLALMFAVFFIIISVYWMDHVFLMPLPEKITGAIALFAAIVLVVAAGFAVRYVVYKRWADSVPYNLKGWAEFVAARSEAYWQKILYVKLSVSVQLNEKATPLEHEAVMLFMKKWEERWGTTYSDLGFDGGTPDELKAKGLGASADFSKKTLGNLTYTMGWRFLSLAKMLGDSLDHVSISAKGKEKKFKFTPEKDDAFDKASSWQTRHES